MKLKLVALSMSVLGLISCPVMADTQNTQSTPVKHKHHHKVHHHKVHHHVAQYHETHEVIHEAHEYKDMGALPVVEAPRMEQNIYDAMSQNVTRAKSMPDWWNRVGVSGGANFDAHWGNRSQGYQGENTQRLSLNDAYLNANATINDWTKALLSLSYSDTSNASLASAVQGAYSNVYANNSLNLEQAYVTFANYDVSPLFVQVGKQFQDFGRYTIHPLTRTMTQVLSESLHTSVKAGFITRMGFNGSISAYDNTVRQVTVNHNRTVYGAALGYAQPNDQLGYDVGIGYMSNMTGANDVAAHLGNLGSIFASSTFVHTVGAIAVYGDVNSGPFSLGARYTTALQNFNPVDLSTVFGTSLASGAKPWAADITANYGFNAMSKNQNVYLGYQTSSNAVNLALPKNRWLAGYDVDMWKNTTLGLEVAHDTAYSTSKGGTGNSSNTIGARASVKFG